MSSRSPLKAKPLRVPGESLDREIDRGVIESAMGYYVVAAMLCTVAAFEWYRTLTHSPRRPLLFSIMAAVAVMVAVWRNLGIKNKVKNLRLGRDGERCVGQFLERLREDGGQVFHDIPGQDFNLDHVVISPRGVYAIETKTWSKPSPSSTITVEGDSLLVAGRAPDKNPIIQSPNRLAPPFLQRPLHLRRQSLRDAYPHRVDTAQPVPNREHGNGGGIVQLQFPHQVGAVFFDGLGT
jgi:hypothetical protein